MAGSFSKLVRPDYILALLGTCGGSVRADVYTTDKWAGRLSEAFSGGPSRARGWAPADELPAIFEAHDCLLSVGELPGRQLSSKIFGYMATGKPVVHICHAEKDANLAYLRAYPLALCIKDDPSALAENARRLCLFLLWSRGRRLAFDEVRRIMPECSPEYVAAQITDVGMEPR